MSTYHDDSTERFPNDAAAKAYTLEMETNDSIAIMLESISTAQKRAKTIDPLGDDLTNRHASMLNDATQLLAVAARILEWIEVDREECS